ncbi:hypothetical protein ACKKBF_B16700 [Auxenochlorella protothecoides x Auxenochlorella symbiontica]
MQYSCRSILSPSPVLPKTLKQPFNKAACATLPRTRPCRPTCQGGRGPLVTGGRVLPIMSEIAALKAQSSAFERLAGRSAMIGFAVAAAFELAVPRAGVFGGVQANIQLAAVGALGMLALGGLAAAALRRIKGTSLDAFLVRRPAEFGGLFDVDPTLEAVLDTIAAAFANEDME